MGLPRRDHGYSDRRERAGGRWDGAAARTDGVLRAAGLTKRYGRAVALDGLDLEVRAGEVHAFLGPNGAGKTTTIRILLGLLRKDGGEVILLGSDPWRDAVELHRRLAYVPGDVTLWPSLTGGEIIDLLGDLRGGIDTGQRQALTERFDLDTTKKARGYSRSNRQKVALVAALASRAELLLLDEPTAGLDPLMEATFRDCVNDERRDGRTILLSSHLLAEAEALADRVTIIRSGRTVETGTLAEMRHLTTISVEAARAARPGLAVGPGDVAAVTSICFHLDGIPLALELAAARAGALSLQEIAARLTGCMELLARTGAGPARQQTLRASVEWSHQLLSERERAVFRRLAVFAGGWPLEAAETVCSLSPAEQGEVAGLLAGLVDKSLVQADHTPAGSRYRLLEVIRAFASERLAEAGELDQAQERHAGYYTDLAERATAEVWGPGMTGWVPRMDQEADNLRAARRWCARDPARAGIGLRRAAGVWGYWFILGRLVEVAAWLEEALARQGGPGHVRAVALNGLGLIACFRGEPERGRDLFSASIECFQRSPGGRDEGRVWANLGYARALCGDAAGAAEANDHALALARRDGDAWVEAAALWRMGFALALAGDVVRARTLAAAGAGLFSKTGDSRLRAYTLATVGYCLTREGKPAEAIAVLREALGVFEKLPERVGLLRTAIWLAEACAAAGDWPRAAMLLGIVDMLSERISGQPYAFMQAGLDAVAARGPAELGPAWQPTRQAGQVLGRGDQIAAPLWPAENREAAPHANDGLPLTPREFEVAELIARGLTNRQIAARLFIAERTTDTHVSKILAKLGCASRAQVAAIISARSAKGAITRTKGAPGRGGG